MLIRDCVFEQIAGAAIGCKPGGASYVDILRCRIDGLVRMGFALKAMQAVGCVAACRM